MRYLETFEIPVEIFLLFFINNQSEFSITEVKNYMIDKYKVNLLDKRIRTILDTFVLSGKLKSETKKMRTGHLIKYYQFKSLQ